MKNKTNNDFSGIVVCDSITMSVKKKRPDLRWFEAVLVAVVGFVSVIMSFLEMFDFRFNSSAVIKAAVIFSVIYICSTLAGRKTLWITGGSFLVLAGAVYKFSDTIIKGYKCMYNVIYSASNHTEIKYYKLFLEPDAEVYCITVFFIFCIWLLALVIYTFTIHRPNPLIVLVFTFPPIEIGLYNGIELPILWGVLIVAYWIALFAVCSIDIGEYSGGSGGFVRKGNLFFPKRQMRLKVTEKCGILIISSVCIVTALSLAVLKLTGYERSEELNRKRADVKAAVNSFSFDDLASSISSVTEAFGFTIDYESHKLGQQSSIKYKNVTELIVTLNKKYDGAVYLKGYAGAIYEDNEWISLNDGAYGAESRLFGDFERFGVYPQDFPNIFSKTTDSNGSDITIWLEAVKKKNKSFAPYGTDNFGDMKYNADATVSSKKTGVNNYSYKFTPVDSISYDELLSEKSRMVLSASSINDPDWQSQIEEYCSENNLYNYGDYFSVDSELSPKLFSAENMYNNGQSIMAALLESRYKSFVYSNYLQLPQNDDINQVRDAFADIFNEYPAETAAQRINLLNALRDRVNSMAQYSLSPGKTPDNRDFVNYFLLENHQGYCTHYASAGVLLARMAGIPARYATGYVIVGDDFNGSSKNADGTYTINVKDDRSHAWTEIYLDGYGWVPFEFTAGYSDMSINTNTTTSTDNPSEQTETTVTSKTTEDNTTASKSSTTRRNTTSKATATTTAANTKAPIGIGLSSKGALGRIVDSTAFFCIAAVIVIILLIYLRRWLILKLRSKRFSDGAAGARIRYMYIYAEKLLAVMKLRRGSMQYIEFADLVESKLAGSFFPHGQFRSFAELALLSSFGNSQPDKKTADEAQSFITALSSTVYEKSGIFTKFCMRIILVII